MEDTTLTILRDAKVIETFLSRLTKTDTCWTWNGAARPVTGHGFFKYRGLRVSAHRASYVMFKGAIPTGLVIDHICRNPPCVNPEHLRAVTQKQNMENRTGAHKNSRSGVRGVIWSKQAGKWTVSVRHYGKRYHGGTFVDIAEAESAAIALRNRLFTCNNADDNQTSLAA